ncbi:MAG: MBL fold metallo-hydrolase [Candidatus Competibacteraceae bacterium]|nr:MBL fold metallo-hydrolase [Candidatus Competibacteraceae bacterium]
MKLYSIQTGYFKLDGGSMFGVVPKSIWNKIHPADENNLCRWAMRCLLIEDNNRLILIDTGIGNKQDTKFFSHYHLHGDESLDRSLRKVGFHRDDITDIFLTHLHFDHCGGVLEWDSARNGFLPAFKQAKVWSNPMHWQAAMYPNPREKASFLKENFEPIESQGQLHMIHEQGEWLPGWHNMFANGHTDAMMLPRIRYKDTEVWYMADLMASQHHIKIPYVMGFDIRPLDVMKEKQQVLNYAAKNQTILFFEHDPDCECALVTESEKGIVISEKFRLDEY